MKSISTYYLDRSTLEEFLAKESIVDNSSLLIQIFTSLNKRKSIASMLDNISNMLPNSTIIGCTTDGEIMNGKVSTQKTIINFTQFEYTKLKSKVVKHKENGFYSGQTLARELIEDNTQILIAFVDGLHTNGEKFLEGINRVNSSIKIAGGLAGDGAYFSRTFIFTQDDIITKGAVGVTLNSDRLHIHTDHSFNWQKIGRELTITSADNNIVYTINNRTAVDTYSHYLGKIIARRLPAVGIEFPLITKRNGLIVARAVLGKRDDGSLIFGGDFYEGEKVYFGYGNAQKILSQSQKVFRSVQNSNPESIFIYSCMARRRFMPTQVELETIPLQQLAPTSGFFTYGEFYTHKSKELLNQTMTLVALSENQKPIKYIKKFTHTKVDSITRSMDALVHLVNVVRDEIQLQVDTLKGSESLNKELKERMELALFGSKDGLWDWNILDDSIYFSANWKEMLGYRDDELPNLKSSWQSRIHPDDVEKTRANIIKSLKGEIEYIDNTHRLRHKDGHWIWVLERGKTIFDESGKAIRTIGTHTNITKEKEKQLQFLRQAQIIEQIHDSVISTDLNRYITSWNSGASKLLGYTPEEMMGEHVGKLYLQEDYEFLKSCIDEVDRKDEYRTEVRLVKKTGEIIYAEMSLSLLKDEDGKVVGRISYCQDITKRKEAESRLIEQKNILHHQAHHDALTGLPNRILFHERLKEGIIDSQKRDNYLALFFIDLDRFKQINDSLGHDIGDMVLGIVSKRLGSVLGTKDTLSRLGGDEFTIVISNLTQIEEISYIANKMLDIIREPLIIGTHTLYLSISIGISIYPKDSRDRQDLLKYSDSAMYRAKDEGRDRFKYYSSDMTKLAFKRITMTTNLKQALEREEFTIHYQPQIDARDNSMIGMEALIRWQHPVIGLIEPNEFISLAEETGLIVDIDHWMMKMAMEQFKEWYDRGLNPGILSINISFIQLERDDFLDILKQRLSEYNFSPAWLDLEITERQVMQRADRAIAKLVEINRLGISISIDDFGTEYSSLAYLKELPINKIKIDRSFIKDIPNSKNDRAITKTIISLAKSLDINIVAEGVESIEQKIFLVGNGCYIMQGYYYNRPLIPQEIEDKYLTIV
jgi:diguanylate cyclase (GGDEF)-like protein/PAS domain S-box-containing protein